MWLREVRLAPSSRDSSTCNLELFANSSSDKESGKTGGGVGRGLSLEEGKRKGGKGGGGGRWGWRRWCTAE